MTSKMKLFKQLVSEIDISKYDQEEYKQKVDMIYKCIFQNSEQIPVRVSYYTKNKVETYIMNHEEKVEVKKAYPDLFNYKQVGYGYEISKK